MSSIELKERVLERLNSADDAILEEILLMLDLQDGDKVYFTSKAEQKSIAIGLEQIEEGQSFTNEEVEREMEQWLNE